MSPSPHPVGRPPQLTGRPPCPSHALFEVSVAHTRVPRFLQSVPAPWPAILTHPVHTSLLPSFAGLCSPWTVLWGLLFSSHSSVSENPPLQAQPFAECSRCSSPEEAPIFMSPGNPLSLWGAAVQNSGRPVVSLRGP